MKPITRQEQLLNSIATGKSVELEPITREEQYLSAIAGLTDFIPEKPITRKEMFYAKILESRGGGSDTLKNIVAPTDTTGLERVYSEELDYLCYRVADFVPLDKYKGCQILDINNDWVNGGETIISLDTGSFLDELYMIFSVATDNETITYYDIPLTFPKSGFYVQYINSSSGKIPNVQVVVFAESKGGVIEDV